MKTLKYEQLPEQARGFVRVNSRQFYTYIHEQSLNVTPYARKYGDIYFSFWEFPNRNLYGISTTYLGFGNSKYYFVSGESYKKFSTNNQP